MPTNSTDDYRYTQIKVALPANGYAWYENRNGSPNPSAVSAQIFVTAGDGAIPEHSSVTLGAYGQRGKELRGGIHFDLVCYETLCVKSLAYLWGVSEEELRNVKALAEENDGEGKDD